MIGREGFSSADLCGVDERANGAFRDLSEVPNGRIERAPDRDPIRVGRAALDPHERDAELERGCVCVRGRRTMSVTEEARERGRLAYLVRGRGRGHGRATRLVVGRFGDDDLCLHWMSARCRAGGNPDIALRLAWGTRALGRRARPGRAWLALFQTQDGGAGREDLPVGVRAALRGGLSNHALILLRAACDRPEPTWAGEPEPLRREPDDDQLEHRRSTGIGATLDGGVHYGILPTRSSS